MLAVWIYTLASVVFVSILSLIGVFALSLHEERLRRTLVFFVSFAVGVLYGDAFIHLLPESFERLGAAPATSLYVIGGIVLFFVVEKMIRWGQEKVVTAGTRVRPMVALNIAIDGVHNMIDGMLIGASYSVSIPMGVTTTIAVIFHEIPHELGDFAILVHGGLSVRKALLFNFYSGLTAVAGGVLSLVLGPAVEDYSLLVLPVTAGGFIYFAGSDLVPELQRNVKISVTLRQLAFIAGGVGMMAALLFLE